MSGIEVTTITLDDEDMALVADIADRFPGELAIGHEAEAADWVDSQMDDVRPGLTGGLVELERAFETEAPVIHVGRAAPEALPPTPTTYQTPEEATVYDFDIVQLALTSIGGVAYGNRHVRDGRILADVFPKGGYAEKPDTAFGSGEIFDFHADGAVHRDTTPEFFSLHCIRNHEQAPTFFSTVSEEDFDPEIFAALQEPVFAVFYESGRKGATLRDTPIIEREASGKFRLNYYGKDKVAGPDDGLYERALEAFNQALHDNVQEVALGSGEVVFVDNRHVQHGRRAFSAAARAGERRWLRRVFAARDDQLEARILAADGRILDSAYVA